MRLGERPISSYCKIHYRRAIGSVAQGDTLYAASLAENIVFFDPEIDMERVRAVAAQAQINFGTVKNALPLLCWRFPSDLDSNV